MEKTSSNSFIEANSSTDIRDIRSNQFCKISNFIDKADFCCEKCIGSIFHNLSRFQRCKNKRSIGSNERLIHGFHDFSGSITCNSTYDTIRSHKILDSRSLFEKLRITHHIKFSMYISFFEFRLNNVSTEYSSSNRNGGFINKNGVLIYIFSHYLCYGFDILEICSMIHIWWCSYSTHDHMRK